MNDRALEARLEAKLLRKRVVAANGCWLWAGSRFSDGYGQVSFRDRPYRVHRVAAWLWLGARVMEKMALTKYSAVVLHSCDQPLCINPAHLRVGRQIDNMRDRDMKGRHGLKGRRFRRTTSGLEWIG